MSVLLLTSLSTPGSILYVSVISTNPVPPYSSWNTAATNIQDAADNANNGDLILVTNGVYRFGGRPGSAPPDFSTTNRVLLKKSVILQSVNGADVTSIEGYQLGANENYVRCIGFLTNNILVTGFTLTNGAGDGLGHAGGAIGFLALSSSLGQILSNNCVASNCIIRRNVDGGALNCVLKDCLIRDNTNAVNWGGGAENCILTNCVMTNNTVGLGSGGGADKSLLNNCLLIANTQTGTTTSWGGGGASRGTLNNCTLIANVATATQGGGAYLDTLNNCLILSNSAPYGGGGAYVTLNNCDVIGNIGFANGGGVGDNGAVKSIVNNSVVYYNTAPVNPNHYGYNQEVSVNYSCTFPLPTNGFCNFTNSPGFVSMPAGDFHLQSNSACINSGRNSYATNATDLDDNARVVGGSVDIGPYEFQMPSSLLSYAFAQQYGLPTDGSGDFQDTDDDGMNNWQEWVAGTNPTNATSVLTMLKPLASTNSGVITVKWQSVNTRTYYLQRSTNLAAQPPFSSIRSNIIGLSGTTSVTDTNPPSTAGIFYRVGIQ